jgi:pimeloyl-ACP methyl ester carboxylesterase
VQVVDELKQFGAGHANVVAVTPDQYAEITARISTDEGGGPGSWVHEWTRAGEQVEREGRHLEASSRYNLARLPYVEGEAKQDAEARCVEAFGRWAETTADIRPLRVETPEGTVKCWTAGLSATAPRPLLLVCGGIVSVKEQWAPLLRKVGRLGLAGVVTEMPGVGENTQRYTPESWRMFSAVLDAVGGQAQVSQTYAMALSFSGHLALRCAVYDSRIRGIATIGAPVRGVFTDPAWRAALPRITRATLAHSAGIEPAELDRRLPDWALADKDLEALEIPVRYVASRRDTIIPAADVELIARLVPGARILEFDDEHGAPAHTAESQVWIMRGILDTLGGSPLPRAALAAAWPLVRARAALRGPRT